MRIAIVFALALMTVGCIESNDEVILKPDGSGTITSSYENDVTKFEQIIEMAKMMFPPDPGTADVDATPEPLAAVWFKQAADRVEGYEIVKISNAEADGKRTAKVEAKFTSLEAAAKGGAFFSSTVILRKVKLYDGEEEEKPGADTVVEVWKLTLRDAFAEDQGGFNPKDMLPAFEAQLESMDISRTVTPPSAIVKTNGEKSEDGKSVSWNVTYKKIMKSDDLEMVVFFACNDDVKLEAFTYKPDLMAMAPRFMAPPPEPKKEPAVTGEHEGGSEKEGEKEGG